jgi:hypothetical protein
LNLDRRSLPFNIRKTRLESVCQVIKDTRLKDEQVTVFYPQCLFGLDVVPQGTTGGKRLVQPRRDQRMKDM